MFRKDLVKLLAQRPMGLVEIARLQEMAPQDAEDDVRHLIKSLKHSNQYLIVRPAYCRKCGFEFKQDKLHKPGKCPRCHSTWIQEPLLRIEHRR